MNDLRLHVLSLRYSSWSIRAYLALKFAGARFSLRTVEIPDMGTSALDEGPAVVKHASERLAKRRALGSVAGLFPVLFVDGKPIHESLAICEWVAERFPEAGLWPRDSFARAQARAISCEMVSGFGALRSEMSCHVFARVPGFEPSPATLVDILRIQEIWRGCLSESGGPFLFGDFGIADCMYFPVVTRFRTYAIELAPELERYARGVEALPVVRAWREVAQSAPRIPSYDAYLRKLGGDPDAALDGEGPVVR